MTGSLDWMPYRTGHSVGHRFVDGIRYKPIIESLPHVDSPLDCCHVESPTPVEEFSVANVSAATLSEAFGACVAEVGSNLRPKQNLSVVIVDGASRLFDEGSAEVFGGDAEARVHEAKGGFETLRQSSPQRVDFGKVFRCPVVTEWSVASRRDAADVAQSKGINVS